MKTLHAGLTALATCVVACASNGQSASGARVEIYKYSGRLQCQQNGATLEAMTRELTAQDIKVLAARTSNDGRAYATVCGGGSGELHIFEIPQADAERAHAAGFRPISELGRTAGK